MSLSQVSLPLLPDSPGAYMNYLVKRQRTLIERNLALQDDVYKLRHETQEAFTDATTLQARQKELDREQKELYQVSRSYHLVGYNSQLARFSPPPQRYSPSFLLLRLRHSTTAQDDLSESLAASFQRSSSSPDTATTSTDREVDEFVRQFRAIRKTYHKRAIWGEQWAAGKVGWRED